MFIYQRVSRRIAWSEKNFNQFYSILWRIHSFLAWLVRPWKHRMPHIDLGQSLVACSICRTLAQSDMEPREAVPTCAVPNTKLPRPGLHHTSATNSNVKYCKISLDITWWYMISIYIYIWYIYIPSCVYVYMCVWVCVNPYMCICVYVYMCICVTMWVRNVMYIM